MPSTLSRFDISARFAAPFYLNTIRFIAALLLVWQVKAQTQASQVVDFVGQLQSQNVDVRLSAV
jgi:hypothetical protein